MNAKNLLPLTAAAVFALCAGAMVVSATHADNNNLNAAAPAARIVDLPTVTVTPDAADLAHYHTYKDIKIVDLATITVTPAAEDLAQFVAQQAVRIVDMPVHRAPVGRGHAADRGAGRRAGRPAGFALISRRYTLHLRHRASRLRPEQHRNTRP